MPCDTLLLSIGLIPENELSRQLNVRLDPVTSGPVVSSTMETSVDGVFACGNVVHIHDLVDFVTQEALLAGRHAGLPSPARGRRPTTSGSSPATTWRTACRTRFRPTASTPSICVCAGRWRRAISASARLYERKLRYVFPAEMITLKVRPAILQKFHGDSLPVHVLPRATGLDDAEDAETA